MQRTPNRRKSQGCTKIHCAVNYYTHTKISLDTSITRSHSLEILYHLHSTVNIPTFKVF